jgi:hypothetical protein
MGLIRSMPTTQPVSFHAVDPFTRFGYPAALPG